jgi:hypothetical protein
VIALSRTHPARVRETRAERVLAVLRAGCKRGEQRFMLGTYAVFALLAVALAVLGIGTKPQLAVVLPVLLALPTFFLWVGWFARLLVLRAQLDELRAPSVRRDAGWALVAMALATIVLPALACASQGNTLTFALSVLGMAAGLGLLLALLPRGLVGLLGFVPMVLIALDLGGPLGAFASQPLALPALAVGSWLLVALRWTRVLARMPQWNEPSWRQPLVFGMARRGSFWAGGDFIDARAQVGAVPLWLRQVDRPRELGPAQPVRTLQALLGGVFTPLGWRQRLATYALYAVLAWVVWRYVSGDRESPWELLLFIGLSSGGAMLLGPFAARLQALQQRHGGELALLSLLPGFGGAPRVRGYLLRAILRPYLAACGGVLALMAAAAGMSGDPFVVALAVLCVLALAVLGAYAWLRPLAGRPWALHVGFALAGLVLGVPVVVVTLVGFRGGGALPWAATIWTGLLLFGGWLVQRTWRRFAAQPHPVLMR